jgi:hypothetical protein
MQYLQKKHIHGTKGRKASEGADVEEAGTSVEDVQAMMGFQHTSGSQL